MSRNFSARDLNGHTFRGQNLVGAKFCNAQLEGADLRETLLHSADFRGANLTGARFDRAALGRHWMFQLVHVAAACAISTISSSVAFLLLFILVTLAGANLKQGVNQPGWTGGIAAGFLVMGAFAQFGVSSKTLKFVLWGVAGTSILFACIGITQVIQSYRRDPMSGVAEAAVAAAFSIAFLLAGLTAGAGCSLSAVICSLAGRAAVLPTAALICSIAVVAGVSGLVFQRNEWIVSAATAWALILPAFHMIVSRRVSRRHIGFELISDLSVRLGAWGGARFSNATCAGATFSGADVQGTNFRDAYLKGVHWRGVFRFEGAYFTDPALARREVRELIVTGKGRGENLTRADLHALDLSGGDLSDADLTQANCVGTDFTGANLNGACIDSWNVDASTVMRDIRCEYVYLSRRSASGDRTRRPADKNRKFGLNEFEQLFARVTTLDVMLRDLSNAEAKRRVISDFANRNPSVSVTKAVKRDGYLVLGLALPPGASEEQIERDLRTAWDVTATASGDEFNADNYAASTIDLIARDFSSGTGLEATVEDSQAYDRTTADAERLNQGSAGESRRVFVSYRRPNYYFAESLVWRLEKAGYNVWFDTTGLRPGRRWEDQVFDAIDSADCFILVASPSLCDSEHTHGCQYVQSEVNRAVDRRKKIITALFQSTRLPDYVPGCDVVDFRGAFDLACEELLARIRANEQPPPEAIERKRYNPIFKLPPGVAIITLGLFVPALAYFLGVDYALDRKDGPALNVVLAVLMTLGVVGGLYFVFVSFLKRRMGMTRLVVCLASFSFITLRPIVEYLLTGPTAIHDLAPGMSRRIAANWVLAAIPGIIPVLVLLYIVVGQPEDLLRWTPTGKAWSWYRARRRRGESAKSLDSSEPNEVRCVLHDEDDRPAGEHLSSQLGATLASEASEAAQSAGIVLLLTDRTRVAWLLSQLPHLDSGTVLFVGTSIRLPSELSRLWEWPLIDFRLWNRTELVRVEELPSVPEKLSTARMPAAVSAVQHLLCALGAIVVVITPIGLGHVHSGKPDEGGGPLENVAVALGIAMTILAYKAANRSISHQRFRQAATVGIAAAAILTAVMTYSATRHGFGIGQLWSAAVFPVFAIWMAVRLRSRIEFWFPRRGAGRRRQHSLASSKVWRPLVWTLVYLLVWSYLLMP